MIQPIYHDLSVKLEEFVRQQSPGDRLPGSAKLAEQFSVNQRTIIKALNILREKNLIYTRGTHGTFVTQTQKRPRYHAIGLAGVSFEESANARMLEHLSEKFAPYRLLGLSNLGMLEPEMCLQFPVDGFVLIGSSSRLALVEKLRQNNIPVVVGAPYIPGVDRAENDLHGIYTFMLDKLMALGHRSIGFVEFARDADFQRYLDDILACFQKQLGKNFDPSLLFINPADNLQWRRLGDRYLYEYAEKATEYFLRLDHVPTAIIAIEPVLSGIHTALKHRHVRVPQDISLFAVSYPTRYVEGVSSIVPRPDQLINWGVQRIIDRLDEPDLQAQERLIPGDYVPGNTIGKAKIRS